MGLLNNAKNQKKLTGIITKHSQKLIILSFFIGVTWFCLLASDTFNNKTYFSENALLPGLVLLEFNPRSSLSNRLASLKDEAKTHPATLPSVWIQGQFHQLGLDVYQNNFSVYYPLGSKPTYIGKNLYAVLRAPKVASTEALVISTPYRNDDSIHKDTFASIALMIELAQAFRKQKYWSKDIIFLVTQFENIGFQAWLDAYHDVSTSDFIVTERLRSTSGLIQGVINLEISHDRFSHIDIKIEGLHGQLPNLDFFNLLVELCTREQVPISFQAQFNYYPSRPINWYSWKHNFGTMSYMLSMQAMGLPTSGHGLFHRFGIQALTLKSMTKKGSNSVTVVQFGRVIEGAMRSLNNLLEKFHQSFFFYLLPSTLTYISIGLYFPPFSLIAIPVLLKALHLYLNIYKSNALLTSLSKRANYWIAYDIFILHPFFGIIMLFVPTYVDYVREFLHYSTEGLLYIIVLAVMSLWLLLTISINFHSSISKNEFSYKMCIVLLMLGGFMFTLALVNISFSLIFTLLYVPASITLQYKAQSYAMNHSAIWWTHFIHGVEGQKKVILFSIEDMFFFGNWNYKIFSLILFPLWYSFISLKILNTDENE